MRFYNSTCVFLPRKNVRGLALVKGWYYTLFLFAFSGLLQDLHAFDLSYCHT